MKKIAVFTSHVYEEMSGLMQKGINAAAIDLGVKVIYFAGFGDSYSYRNFGEFTRYDEGDNISYDIPDLEDFDGIIKISTYFNDLTKMHLREKLSHAPIPVINIGGRDDYLKNIYCNEVESFSAVVEHIISCHGCKDIYHLAGLPDKSYTHQRIAAYKKVLTDHGIPVEDDKIYFGTLWRDCGEAALDYILDQCSKRGKKYPDAIVCANDYSAFGLINECKLRGIRVPEDIIITGYDGVKEAMDGYPSITTSRQPFYAVGYKAVGTILEMIDGVNIPDETLIMGDLFCNQSCGCKKNTADNIEDVRKNYLIRLRNTTNIAQSTTNLMIRVSNMDTLDECFKAIANNAKKHIGFKKMLMCMAPDWDKQRIIEGDFSKVNEEMTVVSGFDGEKDISDITFMKKDILPKYLLEDPNPYYIYTLHNLQYYMGYLIVDPDIDYKEQEAVQSWLVDLAVILEDLRLKRDLMESVTRLEFLSNRDMLTGIYNRRGVDLFFRSFYDDCRADGTGLAVMTFDMDDLKMVNDKYGHSEGDYSIKTVADALVYSAGEDEICTRAGGDEFVVLAKNYNEERLNAYISKVRSYISARVQEDSKQYEINISAGAHMEFPTEEPAKDIQKLFEKYQTIADTAMYEEKKSHKNGRELR